MIYLLSRMKKFYTTTLLIMALAMPALAYVVTDCIEVAVESADRTARAFELLGKELSDEQYNHFFQKALAACENEQ